MNWLAGRRFTLLFLLLLAVGIAVSYANSFKIGYELDDAYVINVNPAIRSLGNIPRFFVDPFTLTTIRENADPRPALMITYALNYAVSGLKPWSYHLLSILLHFVAAILVFIIVRDFVWWPPAERGPAGASRVPAAAAALFFALAPLNGQPVIYMSARSALLATSLYLAAFLTFLYRRWIAMAILFVLALLTKAIAVTLPVTILLYDFLYRDRTRYPTVAAYLRDWRRLVLPVLLPAGIVVAYLAYRQAIVPAWLRQASRQSFVTPWIWFMTEWSAYLSYVRLFLWPVGLSVDHDSVYATSLSQMRAWLPLCVILLWIGLALWQGARRPLVAFATLWFFVTLAPESTFVALAEVTNDHRPYIATSLGLSVLLAWALYELAAHLGRWRTPAFAAVCIILCVAAVPVNQHRNWLWQDSVRLWQDAVVTGPGNPRAWMNAGKALMNRGRYAEARVYLERAREMAPNYSFAYLNLSALERLTGNSAGALREAESAVQVGPRFSMAHYYHGFALEQLGAPSKAREAYELALQLNPNEPGAKDALARLRTTDGDAADMSAGVQALYVDRDPERATTIFRRVLARNPSHYGATLQLAKALDRGGKRQDAQPLWEKMLGMAEAANDQETLSTVRTRLAESAGPPPTARQALDSPAVPAEDSMRAGLEALYQRNDPGTAAIQFRKVLAANPSHYGATLQLAKALDRAGKRQEAQPLWEKMLGMAKAAGDQETLATVRARLAESAGPSPTARQVLGSPAAPAEDPMKAGLDALYQRNDPGTAAIQFRKVLAANPSHYGATLQLAKALDRSGKRQEAQPLWEKMLGMAEAARDEETLRTVRARLAEKS